MAHAPNRFDHERISTSKSPFRHLKGVRGEYQGSLFPALFVGLVSRQFRADGSKTRVPCYVVTETQTLDLATLATSSPFVWCAAFYQGRF